ncbi:FtsK/SpoIIIE family DNA translocase [Salsuginibacillus kocurii]|uniref:FtsK/SpoIIIE family DNA translocase n=1 Tax=Salsuginibacillus kocurii TaxID=427078 RepID=UPI00035F0332|nr:DNA translocase FtsK [Salsuginibacillus kocurii]
MAKKKKKKQSKQSWRTQFGYELGALALFALSLFALFGLGIVGWTLIQLFRLFVGEWHMIITIVLMFLSGYLMVKRSFPPLVTKRMMGFYFLMGGLLLLTHVRLFEALGASGPFSEGSVLINTWMLYWMEITGQMSSADIGGGMLGALLFAMSHFLFDTAGTRVVAVLFFLIAFLFITNRSFHEIGTKFLHNLKKIYLTLKQKIQTKQQARQQSKAQKQEPASTKTKEKQDKPAPEPANSAEVEEPVIYSFTDQAQPKKKKEAAAVKPANEAEEEQPPVSLLQAETENEAYELPSMNLLQTPAKENQTYERSQISSNAKILEDTLQSFGVQAKVIEVHVGPAVTKYEIQPSTGVKVSKIVNLADDIALALAAKDIRIEAPIPGKAAVGIEVPNQAVSMVTLREVLESESEDHILSVALGRDISGKPIMASLNKMPHLLVAGATGSGKSVCINGIVTSILLKAKPHEVKLMMIDPKMVELNVYNGVPHLLSPVVTEPKKAAQALKKVVAEMERRYDLFSHSGTRNIEGYNDYVKKHNDTKEEKQAELPYIVVIVDELADLMMVASGEVEDAITRLAQMARAAGIHMILATQRPSVDVITGVIKANIPSRIAFGVSSQTDSRTILDAGGAEKLLGKGDMLYMPVGSNKSTRVQGAFLSDEEVEQVVEAIVEQQKAVYQEDMIPSEEPEETKDVEDELYPEAVEFIVNKQSASVSMLQRRFRIGYTRAARLVDEMEARGVVGPYEGKKPRDVLIGSVDYLERSDERRSTS